MEENKARIARVNGIFAGTIIVNIVASLLMGVLADQFGFQMTMMQSLVFSQIIFVIPALIYVIKYRINLVELIRMKPIHITTVFLLVIFAFAIQPLMNLINLISLLFVKARTTEAIQSGVLQVPLIVGILIVAVLPAICEESVYRGIFYHEYRKVDAKKAVLLSGFLFGIFHMNINQFAYAVVLGIAFALVVEATDSIFSSMICHFVINGSSVLISYQMSATELAKQAKQLQQIDQMTQIAACILPAVIGTIIAVLLLRFIASQEGREEQIKSIFHKSDRTKEKKQKLITWPLGLSIAFCIVFMLALR